MQFGGCLALRVALAAPELLERLVLVNPATCFDKSLGGLSSLIASTNLLSIFPSPLYAVHRPASAVAAPWTKLLPCCSVSDCIQHAGLKRGGREGQLCRVSGIRRKSLYLEGTSAYTLKARLLIP